MQSKIKLQLKHGADGSLQQSILRGAAAYALSISLLRRGANSTRRLKMEYSLATTIDQKTLCLQPKNKKVDDQLRLRV